ncbi:hypothetical protein Sjap_004588 [Stephania japonica]|uniref:Expansin-like EG45 domain-containing protein n=1 Tax=Stephania japonica TaxID=461633 RepID=A0AAP0PKD3_9MAGN
MGLAFNLFCSLCLLVLLPAALCHSDYPYTRSRAAFYGTPDGLGTPSGACGYGDFGRTLNDGIVAAVSNRLYKNGLGRGACYQLDQSAARARTSILETFFEDLSELCTSLVLV